MMRSILKCLIPAIRHKKLYYSRLQKVEITLLAQVQKHYQKLKGYKRQIIDTDRSSALVEKLT